MSDKGHFLGQTRNWDRVQIMDIEKEQGRLKTGCVHIVLNEKVEVVVSSSASITSG